jgi:four helix bundle protein
MTLDIYRTTSTFPREELYGLVSQMRRSAASVPTNIAEGSVRSEAEFRQFLRIALGSAAELDYQLILCHDLGYLATDAYGEFAARVNSIKRTLTVFIQRLERAQSDAPAYGLEPTAYSPNGVRP